MIRDNEDRFKELGLVCFENTAVKEDGARGVKHAKHALLNEDQCYFLLALSRNSERVVALKLELVKHFLTPAPAKRIV